MRLPYFDKVHPETLRLRIRLTLLALPLVLGTAAIYLAYVSLILLLPLFGIDPSLPLHTQPYGELVIVILVVTIVLFFLAGAFVGFWANTWVCRFALGWDRPKVNEVFYEQAIPSSWLKDGGSDTEKSNL
ncbi:MAG: hypothetical protein AAF290_00040 [Pseudomonadota bacterium]